MAIRRHLPVLAAMLFLSAPAWAGKDIRGSGPTPELACWDYENKANNHAGGGGAGCYASCKRKDVQYDATSKTYWYVFNNPNHPGSCKAKYDRKHTDNFAKAYPRPRAMNAAYSPPPAERPAYDYQATVCDGRVGVIRPSTDKFVALHALHGPVMIRWVFQKNGKVTSTMDIQAFPHQPETATAQAGGTVGFDCI